MTIQKVVANTRGTLVTCVTKTTDAGAFTEATVGDYYKHQDTGFAFKVNEISVEHKAGYIIMNVILEQVGSWHKRIKSSTEAKDLLFESLVKITDQEEIRKIGRESCYC